MRGNSNFVGITKTQQNCLKQDVVLLNREQIMKVLIRLHGFTGWSASLLFVLFFFLQNSKIALPGVMIKI